MGELSEERKNCIKCGKEVEKPIYAAVCLGDPQKPTAMNKPQTYHLECLLAANMLTRQETLDAIEKWKSKYAN